MTRTFQYVPHAQVPAFLEAGWVVVDNMADVHHGHYSVLMRRRTWAEWLFGATHHATPSRHTR